MMGFHEIEKLNVNEENELESERKLEELENRLAISDNNTVCVCGGTDYGGREAGNRST